MFLPELATLTAVAVAALDSTGLLVEANGGFLRLINSGPLKPHTEHVDRFFIQPTFTELINAAPDADGRIHDGLLTLGEDTGRTCSLNARIWREGNQLRLLAEHDIASLEHLSETVLQLNSDYAKAQFVIIQINHTLKQREIELEQSLAQLEATNLRLTTAQKQLVEAEKMASLGVMVAGVAHEINTPLGVSLGSASLLERQSQLLAQRFAERRMTASELNGFLQNALAETGLMRANLERISHLSDSFHQLAVNDKTSTKSRFKIKQCIDDVVTSLGGNVPDGKITIRVLCDQALEIESVRDAWASIFTNLVSNSLRHGFKGRDHGTIEIRVASQANNLVVDYVDDGTGLSAETLARIFDPFFTTDMQRGMGLGMHYIYNLVTHKLRGRIACTSPSGHGAHFHIEVSL